MAYEYESKLYANSVVHSMTENVFIETGETKEIKEVYRKAKAFDEVKEFIIKKLKEEEEEKPRTLLSDCDFGLYQAYDNVDDIIEKYDMEDKQNGL